MGCLGRDPRAGTYGRLTAARARAGEFSEPLTELLDAMRDRAPAGDSTSAPPGVSVLRRLVTEHAQGERASVKWSTSARIRVRTRNVLRRWAAAQTDPRLAWVNPLAPLLNLQAVATVFVDLYLRALDEDNAELGAVDIDDLWARWFVPIFGTGRQDGWIDRTGVAEEALAEHVAGGFAEMASALCWLAIRPGPARRERFVAWQAALAAALDRGVLDATEDCAEYVSLITGHDVTRSQIETDLLGAIEFMDDRLWCAKTADELELDALELEAGPLGEDSVKAVVRGVTEPLQDPRLARLVVALRAYRRVDAVVVFSPASAVGGHVIMPNRGCDLQRRLIGA